MANTRKTQRGNRKRRGKAARRGAATNHKDRRREVVGVLGLGLAIFLVAGLLSLQLGDGRLLGPFGRSFAVLAYALAGIPAYALVAGLGLVSIRLLLDRRPLCRPHHVIGVGLGALSAGVFLHLVAGGYRVAGYGPGGIFSGQVAETSRALLSTFGTGLVAAVGVLLAVVVATPLRMSQVLALLGGAGRSLGLGALTGARRVGSDAARFSGEVIRAVLPERDHDEYLDDDEYYDDEDEDDEFDVDTPPPIIDARSGRVIVEESAAGDTIKNESPDELPEVAEEPKKKAKKSKRKSKKAAAAVAATAETEADTEAAEAETEDEAPSEELAGDTAPAAATAADEAKGPVIVESKFKATNPDDMKKKEAEAEQSRLDFIPLQDGEYKLPPVSLLDYDASKSDSFDRQAMYEMAARLTQTLENYGVKGEVAAIRPGPVVTMYEFAPAPGTRLNKIVNLGDDLAMALEALKVRIVAPIPGKAAVGIEVPNRQRETVYLKEIIADEGFRNPKVKLPMALGKDIEGGPQTVDLAKMPHLLVAGTTGSGKSVSVNSMITSLLYACSPEDVRMIMVDPKMLELSIYEGVPHLLLPVVTDPKKANIALRWAVDEMERRYDLLAKMGVRDIASYNKKLEKVRAKWEAESLQRAADQAKARAEEELEDGVEETQVGQMELPVDDAEPPRNLPYIVIVIDEFADLIMCAPKEVETSVARIAQKARAAGIHLILATQRPSVDVITGLIKANFPSRIAFRVASKVDSRTILDQPGAEALLGSGDMLFSDRGSSPERLHGCFVDEEEIHRVVDFLKTQGKPIYNMDILKPRDDEDEGGAGGSDDAGGGSGDDLYDRAVKIVAETQRVSVSYLQRRLSVGYNRAAKLVEQMEQEGVVSPPDNKKQREVLISAA